MTEERKPNRVKILLLLSVSLVIQSLSSVFIKYAGKYETLSKEFIFFYVLAIGCLGVFAIMWQLLLELIPLTTAYLRKGILYILILIWSVILFKEQVTIYNIIGSIIIIAGISLHGMDEH
jgi:multidrug transporter EmrE-like cation transporter